MKPIRLIISIIICLLISFVAFYFSGEIGLSILFFICFFGITSGLLNVFGIRGDSDGYSGDDVVNF